MSLKTLMDPGLTPGLGMFVCALHRPVRSSWSSSCTKWREKVLSTCIQEPLHRTDTWLCPLKAKQAVLSSWTAHFCFGSNISCSLAPIFYGCFGVLLGGRNVWDKYGCESRECWITLLINTGFWSLLTADSVSVWPAPIKPQQLWDKEEAVSPRVWCTRSRVHNAAPSVKAQAQLARAGGHRTSSMVMAAEWAEVQSQTCWQPHSLLCGEAPCQLVTFIWGTQHAVGHGSAN